MCFGAISLHAAPDGAGMSILTESYKHVAPPEQGPQTNKMIFVQNQFNERDNQRRTDHVYGKATK
jgi:hypothetical protein